jgi:hypothetical protein
LGVRSSVFEVIKWQYLKYSASAVLKNHRDNFVWRLIVVYGSHYDNSKLGFISELDTSMGDWQGPTLIGGDFNLVRSQKEKKAMEISISITPMLLMTLLTDGDSWKLRTRVGILLGPITKSALSWPL